MGRVSDPQLQVGKNLNYLIQRFKGELSELYVRKTSHGDKISQATPVRVYKTKKKQKNNNL